MGLSGVEATVEPILARFVRRYRRALFSVALARTGRVDVADDVVQTALLRAAKPGRMERVENPWSYLRTAVENLCRNRGREPKTEVLVTEPAASPADAPDRAIARRELGDLLHDAIRALPESQRIVVWLVHVEGMTPTEVASAIESPLPTVKSSLARGRRRLRERLGPILRRAGYLDAL